MTARLTITWHNAGPHTIWGKLSARLGREPTAAEAADEVKRILGVPRSFATPVIQEDGNGT